MNASTSVLRQSFSEQDKQFAQAFSILRDAIAERVFPAASVAVTHQGKLVALKALGHFIYKDDVAGASLFSGSRRKGGNSSVTPSTLFDLASVTKAVATTTVAAILYERGLLELDAAVAGTIPEFLGHSSGKSDPRRRDVTFRMLLAHSSGLPAYAKLFLQAHSRDELLRAALVTPLTGDPDCHAEYSDLGFIILGAALERIAEEPLDTFCQREIFGPFAMTRTTFNPPPEIRAEIPPTADERNSSLGSAAETCGKECPRHTFRNRIIQGEVQDENAYVLGGLAGHAGLFSTAEDVARFADIMLRGGGSILCPETIALFTRRESAPAGTSRALGWDTPSSPSQSGKHFGSRSFGHLGYTGTSLWIDPERQLSITLLTNRSWPDCSNQAIKEVRPGVHDAVIEAIETL